MLHILSTDALGYALKTNIGRNHHRDDIEIYKQQDFANELRDVTITQDSKHEMILKSGGRIHVQRLVIPEIETLNLENMSGLIDELHIPACKKLKILGYTGTEKLQINKIISPVLSTVRNVRKNAFIGKIDAPKLYSMDVPMHEDGAMNIVPKYANVVASENFHDGNTDYRFASIVVDNTEKIVPFTRTRLTDPFKAVKDGYLLTFDAFRKSYGELLDRDENQANSQQFLQGIEGLKL